MLISWEQKVHKCEGNMFCRCPQRLCKPVFFASRYVPGLLHVASVFTVPIGSSVKSFFLCALGYGEPLLLLWRTLAGQVAVKTPQVTLCLAVREIMELPAAAYLKIPVKGVPHSKVRSPAALLSGKWRSALLRRGRKGLPETRGSCQIKCLK